MLSHSVPRLGELVADCPPPLENLVTRCLERESDKRPASADEVISVLREVFAPLAGTPADDWPVEPLPAAAIDASAPVVEGGTIAGPVLGNQTAEQPSDEYIRLGAKLPPTDASPVGGALRAPATLPQPLRFPAAVPRSARARLEPGARVKRFMVHELVATGQTGHLYKAFDPVRSRLVGLKVIDDRTGIAVNRLLRASRIWLDLHHANLQRILEVDPGAPGEPALIVTELIEGVDLAHLIAQQKLDLAQKVDVVIQVCDAVDYMHQRGVVHREIKPRNIVLSRDLQVTLLDSGLARSTTMEDTSFTQVGVAVGDLTYMAPEQAKGRCDQRSDVYSLGAVLYEMVMEEPPLPLGDAGMVSRLGRIDFLPAMDCSDDAPPQASSSRARGRRQPLRLN
jgi:hypothetical protein